MDAIILPLNQFTAAVKSKKLILVGKGRSLAIWGRRPSNLLCPMSKPSDLFSMVVKTLASTWWKKNCPYSSASLCIVVVSLLSRRRLPVSLLGLLLYSTTSTSLLLLCGAEAPTMLRLIPGRRRFSTPLARDRCYPLPVHHLLAIKPHAWSPSR